MQSKLEWRAHFNVSDSTVKAFHLANPSMNESGNQSAPLFELQLLKWCIEQNLLSADDFTLWASSRSDLPVIRADYFDAPPDAVFWESVKDSYPWNSECFPITEWDGVLLVATVFPLVEITLVKRHRLVLANPVHLARYHDRLITPSIQTPPTVADASLPVPEKIEPEKIGDEDFFSKMQRELNLNVSQESATHDGSEPEGETADETGDETLDAQAAPEGLAIPEGLVLSHQETVVEPSVSAPQEPVLVAPLLPVLVMPPPPLDTRETITPKTITPESETKAEPQVDNGPSSLDGTKVGLKGRKLEAPVVTSFFSTNPSFQNETTTATSTFASSSASKSTLSPNDGPPRTMVFSMTADIVRRKTIPVNTIEPVPLEKCKNIDELGAQVLIQTCGVFENAMILLFKDGKLIPWKWSDLLLSVKGEKPDSIDLKENSIFKIVFRTGKPYHGYVVSNPINQKFFNEYTRGMPPQHATILPLMIDGRMAGMLLGFTNGKIDYRQSLRNAERISTDLARYFKNLRGTLQQAS